MKKKLKKLPPFKEILRYCAVSNAYIKEHIKATEKTGALYLAINELLYGKEHIDEAVRIKAEKSLEIVRKSIEHARSVLESEVLKKKVKSKRMASLAALKAFHHQNLRLLDAVRQKFEAVKQKHSGGENGSKENSELV